MDIPGTTPRPDREERSVPDTPVSGGTPVDATPAAGPTEISGGGSARLFGVLAVYTLLRLALVAVLTAVLALFMPLIVALLFAVIAQLPLAWLLFGGPRARVNQAIAVATARRRAERDRLQAGLTGDLGS